MKKKNVVLIGIVVLVIIGVGLFTYQKIQSAEQEKKLTKKIDSSFYETMKTTEETPLYQKEGSTYRETGKISQGISLYLKKTPLTSSKDHYYMVEDTPYYLDYKSLEKVEGIPTFESSYVPFSEQVVTKNDYTLTDETSRKIVQTKSNRYRILTKEESRYQVIFQNRIWYLDKPEVETVETIEENSSSTKAISILLVSKMKDATLQKELTLIKDEKYETITIEDYQKWARGEVLLPEKSLLLITEDDSVVTQVQQTNHKISLVKVKDLNWVKNNIKSKLGEEHPSYYEWKSTTTEADFAKMLKGEKVVIVVPTPTRTAKPSNSPYATSVPVLNYHFFYNGALGNPCKENICLEAKKFEQQLSYLKENGFKALTLEEYRAWIYGEINLPKKSVLITIDDGAMGTSKINGNILNPLLEKYQMHATLFLITAWWDKANYASPYLEVESHGYDIHIRATCDGKSKAKALCLSKEELKADLQKSIEILGSKKAFCFPFYAYSTTAVEAVQEAGFPLAFIGGNKKSTRSNHKLKIPRYPIYESTTFEQFKAMVN